MNIFTRIGAISLLMIVSFGSLQNAFGEDDEFLIAGETPKPTKTPDPVTAPKLPVIESIVIKGQKEYSGARVNLRGKNLLPAKGSATVLFPSKDGGSVSVGNFQTASDSLLIFALPEKAASGNVTITTKGERGGSATSNPYYFEFHQPVILFVTGDEGIGPGKKIKIWGQYFDGIYYRDNQRSVYAPIQNGTLKGAEKSVGGNLSVMEVSLPEGAFQKEFWVERNCDDNGENCLKSNTITFSSAIPPLLTEIQPDYKNRTATLFGKNFPEDEDDFRVSFGSSSASVLSYDYEKNKAVIEMPCPLPPSAEVSIKVNNIESNTIVFIPKEVPQIIGIKLQGSRTGENRDLEVSVSVPRDIKASDACTEKDKTLTIGSKSFPIKPFGGAYVAQNIPFGDIPEKGDATVTVNGMKSPPIAFSKSVFNMLPHIYSIEGKYGFRPGVPFAINGRNFDGEYEACKIGDVSIKGPKVYAEEYHKELTGYDENGEPEFNEVCYRQTPKVSSNRIEAQFAGITPKEGQEITKTKISVSVGKSESNILEVPFGSFTANAVFAPPEIRSIAYPYGHNIGDEITIYGSNFSPLKDQNAVAFGSVTVSPKSVNIRGTELTVEIPEGAGTSITVTRKTPDVQVSQVFEAKITAYPDERLSFQLTESAADEISVADGKSFSLAKFSVINSIGDLQVNRFHVLLDWADADPEYAYSLKKLNIAPFEPFTLNVGNSVVSGPITAGISGDNKIILDFPPFILPLTVEGEITISIESQLMHFVKPGSRFRLRFAPGLESDFVAADLNRKKGVRPQIEEIIITSETEVVGKDLSRCIDTDKSNAHCQHYYEQISPQVESAESPSANFPQDATSVQRQKKIQQILKSQKLESKEKELLSLYDRVIESVRKKSGDAAAEKVRQTLLAKKTNALNTYNESLSQANAEKLEQRKKEIAAESLARKQALAEALLKKVAAAERLLKSRLDTDKDGLSDAEEELLGTDKSKTDSDGDGYSDFLEIEFGYSPTDKKVELVFSDLKSAGSATSAISRLTAFKIISGYEDGTFRPNVSASRAQFLSGLIRIFYGAYLEAPVKSVYFDVQVTDWFAPEVAVAKAKKFLSTDADYTFRPYEAISRLEACELIYRIAEKSLEEREPLMRYGDLSRQEAVIAEACVLDGLIPSVGLALPEEVSADISPEPSATPSPSSSITPSISPVGSVSTSPSAVSPSPTATPEVIEKPDFSPDAPLTRAEMAVMVIRALRLK